MSLVNISFTPTQKLNIAAVNLIFVEKILNFYWISKNKNRLSIYRNLKEKIYLRGLLTYTSFGSYCLLLMSLYETLTRKQLSPLIINCCWSILFSVTSGYYIYVIPGILKSPDPKNWFLNILSHGPYLIITTCNLYLRFPSSIPLNYYSELRYCLLYSYGWLSCVWFPWYTITGDYMYPPLSSNLSLKKRFLNILKMSLLLSVGVSGKYIIFNKLIKEKIK